MEEPLLKKRRKIIVTAVFILFAAVAAVALLNERSVRDKIVDYWEEQSRQYTAFQKELAEGIAPNHALIVKSISEDKYAYQGLGEEEKQVYDELLYTILHYKEKVQLENGDIVSFADEQYRFFG